MIEGLVNLITPAYNSAGFIHRLLDSVLMQTYPMIKMYIIDDGSTDNTHEVIEKYKPLFAKKGYELRYVYQENAGISFAINNALKLVDGEYLLWPDSDDWYKKADSIEKLVDALQEFGDEVGIARCRYEFVSDHSFIANGSNSYPNYGFPESVLDDAVYYRNGFINVPGGWIIKTRYLDSFIPNRNIFTEKDAGQNAQILLPYVANCKCVSVDDILFCYFVREDSHSRAKGHEKENSRVEAYMHTYIHVLNILPELESSKREEYKQIIQRMFYSRLLKNDVEYYVTSSFRLHFKECKDLCVPLPKRYMKMGYWTKMFSIKSYFMFSKCHARLRSIMFPSK